MKAEQLMMEDAPLMILWYEENYRLIKSNVRNFYSNPMRYRDYKEVYLKGAENAATADASKEAEKK